MRSIYLVLACSLLLFSCQSGTQNKTGNHDTAMVVSVARLPVQSKLDSTGTNDMINIVNGYYGIKNALVATSATRTDSMANAFMLNIDDLQAYINKDTGAKQLQPYLDTIISENKSLIAVKDPTCEQQRAHFSKISDVLFAMLKKSELKNAGVYREYCPMAFNEKGAFWLSNETEIKNPYFGKKMIECGDVEDSLK